MKNPMTFGYVILFLLFVLAMVIAIAHVEQNTSFGLRDVITILGVLAGAWSQYAFAKKNEEPK